MQRYHRQMLLPWIGPEGQARISRSRLLLIGCGALGTTSADQLVRAGVGFLRIVDRDIVEPTNLQRQTLFCESDARDGTPKSIAATQRLAEINRQVALEPVIADVSAVNIEALLDVENQKVDLILDGTDNAQTRYLINDVALKHQIPWIYGACVGMEGRAMTVRPGITPCLRCLFPELPGAGELPTCDTTGVLGPLASIVASLQAADALKLLAGRADLVPVQLTSLNLMNGRFHAVNTAKAQRLGCPACSGRYDFLESETASDTTTLCGRNTIQVRMAGAKRIDLSRLAEMLRAAGAVEQSAYLVRCRLAESDLVLTLFPDARLLIQGTTDPALARSLYARYIGI